MARRTVDETETSLGEQVRRLRIDAQLTQEDVARRADVSKATVSALESGRGSSLPTLIRVLRVLGRDDWFDEIRPDEGPSPLELLRAERRQPTPRRVRRPRNAA